MACHYKVLPSQLMHLSPQEFVFNLKCWQDSIERNMNDPMNAILSNLLG